MLIDLEELGAPFSHLQKAAVCIAGAGIAGLVLATTLADAGIDVILLEAGGRKTEDRSQEIYEAEMAATTHAGTTVGRFRVFGGSSVRWGGQLLPYTEDIFSPSSESLSSSWPIRSAALESLYPRVEEILGADHLPFSTELYQALGMSVPANLDSNPNINLRFSKWAPFSHRNVARTLGTRAIQSGRINVFLHANVTECLLSSNGSRIDALLVRNYQGNCFRFEAQQYVVAMGTIETSRLLLASRSVCPSGVGNENDRVGRGFHDHVSAAVADLDGEARHNLLSWLGPFFVGGTTHTARLEASPALRRRLDLLAINAHVTIEEPEDSAGSVARQLLRSIQRGDLQPVILENYKQLPGACVELLRLAYSWKVRKRRPISSAAMVRLHVACEQRTSSDNRIRLSTSSRDALGIPKAVIDWRVSSEEVRSMRCYAEWLRGELERLGASGIKWHPDLAQTNEECFPEIRDTNHPMGGTVMGVNPADTVVDTNLRVHGLSNMYISSCSTYPAGGSSNPTFTLIALSLRLAEYLKQVARSTAGVHSQARVHSGS